MKHVALLLLLAPVLPAAQLVNNGGFENLISTSTSLYPGGLGNAAHWVSAGGSPDFYSNSSLLFFQYTTSQQCFSGNGCAGLLNAPPATNNNNSVQYEYLQTELVSAMVAGVTYHISMMAAWTDRSRVQTADMGFYVSSTNAHNRPTGGIFQPITLTPTYNNPTNSLITSTAWMLYETDYVATGGERYLTIGNFLQTPGYFLPTFVGPNYSSSYFLVDNVSVIGPDPDPVPEPATAATLGLALAGIVAWNRRRTS